MKMLVTFSLIMIVFYIEAQVKVSGYYRKDGTYVQPHERSNPDGNPYNNYGYPGNYNPNTNEISTGDPNTYLENYYKNNSSSRSATNSNSSSGSSSWPSYNTTYDFPKIDYNIKKYYVTGNSVNLRSGPSTKYAILTTLSYNDELEVLENTNATWMKVKVSYFDFNTNSTKSFLGYIHNSFVSQIYSTNFSDSNYGINNNALDNYGILNDKLVSTYHPYGYNNGQITFWTTCSDDGKIDVYLDEEYVGTITKYFLNDSPPDCDSPGALKIVKPAGTYKIKAFGSKRSWEGEVVVTLDQCKFEHLVK